MKSGLFNNLVRCLLFSYNLKYFDNLDHKDNRMGSAKFSVVVPIGESRARYYVICEYS
jgi:hypothetical protein